MHKVKREDNIYIYIQKGGTRHWKERKEKGKKEKWEKEKKKKDVKKRNKNITIFNLGKN